MVFLTMWNMGLSSEKSDQSLLQDSVRSIWKGEYQEKNLERPHRNGSGPCLRCISSQARGTVAQGFNSLNEWQIPCYCQYLRPPFYTTNMKQAQEYIRRWRRFFCLFCLFLFCFVLKSELRIKSLIMVHMLHSHNKYSCRTWFSRCNNMYWSWKMCFASFTEWRLVSLKTFTDFLLQKTLWIVFYMQLGKFSCGSFCKGTLLK